MSIINLSHNRFVFVLSLVSSGEHWIIIHLQKLLIWHPQKHISHHINSKTNHNYRKLIESSSGSYIYHCNFNRSFPYNVWKSLRCRKVSTKSVSKWLFNKKTHTISWVLILLQPLKSHSFVLSKNENQPKKKKRKHLSQ